MSPAPSEAGDLRSGRRVPTRKQVRFCGPSDTWYCSCPVPAEQQRVSALGYSSVIRIVVVWPPIWIAMFQAWLGARATPIWIAQSSCPMRPSGRGVGRGSCRRGRRRGSTAGSLSRPRGRGVRDGRGQPAWCALAGDLEPAPAGHARQRRLRVTRDLRAGSVIHGGVAGARDRDAGSAEVDVDW